MKCHILDVGQASTVVLEFGGGAYGIVDCGGSKGEHAAPIVDFLRSARDREPDMRIIFLMISHLDLDHISGLSVLAADDDLLARMERIYCNDLLYRQTLSVARRVIKQNQGSGIASNPKNRPGLKSLQILGDLGSLFKTKSRERRNFHLECVAPEAGHPETYPVPLRIECGRPDIKFQLWGPTQRLKDEGFQELAQNDMDLLRSLFGTRTSEKWNAASIVLTVDVAGTRFLLAGDSTARTWQEVFEYAGDCWEGADVVVAWHHGGRLGSRDSTNFDDVVWKQTLVRRKKIVAISCGSSNNYGHPHPDTITNITRFGGEIYCTERSRRNLSNGRLKGQSDSIAVQLRGVAKKVWYQTSEQQCCGDITVEVGADGNLLVSCSSGSCSGRVHENGCCIQTAPNQPLLNFSSSN